MVKKTTEHDALKGIDLLLESLSQEERQRVFDWIALKYKIGATSPSEGTPAILTQPSGTPGAPLTTIPTGLSIKDFLIQKKPADYYERVACIVYYLEKVQGVDGAKTSDIVQGNKDAKQSPFSNAGVFINRALSRYGFLTPAGGGKRAADGERERVRADRR